MKLGQTMDGYIRVSRVQGREGDSYISPRVQREAIQRWADYKGVTIAEWHVDEDWSGGTHDRPGIKSAIQRALSGETGGIVSWKIDRFSRNTEKALEDLRRLEANGARLAFVVEDIDTSSVYGRMVYTILLAVSEAFLENVKLGWRDTKSRAIARGAHIGPTPYGYVRGEHGTLTLDSETAPIVSEAFKIAAAKGIRAAQSYLQSAEPARRWTLTQVRRLLSNEIYIGKVTYGENSAMVTDYALTTRPVWEAAQSLPATRSNAAEFPLSGLLSCASCDQSMVGGRGGKGQRVYRCSGSLSQASERCPTGCVVTADHVEAHLKQLTQRLFEEGHWLRRTTPTGDLAALQQAWTDAQDELAAFMSNTRARKALGAAYQAQEDRRVQEVEEAEQAYHEAARQHGESVVPMVDMFDYTDLELARTILRRCYSAVYVLPGRGRKIGERVVTELYDENGERADPDETRRLLTALVGE